MTTQAVPGCEPHRGAEPAVIAAGPDVPAELAATGADPYRAAEPTAAAGPVQPLIAPARLGVRQTFAALAHPNYRLWFMGQLVSLLGSWMQMSAQGFLVYELTRSPAYLGYVGFATGLPAWLFTLFGGVMADRMPRRRLLVLTQLALMLQALLLAALTFSGLIQAWHILVLATTLGVASAFDAPARQAFVPELVDRKDLTNAIALNSATFNSATTVGPALAGIIYAALGPAWCFVVNAASFLAILGALAAMRLAPPAPAPPRRTVVAEVAEGLRFVARHQVIRLLMLGLAVTSVGLGVVTLMPAWAVTVLHGDATTNGLLLSARGLGSLIGALMLAAIGGMVLLGRLLSLGSLVLPVVLLLFATLHTLVASLVALVAVGWAFMVILNSLNTIVQTHVPDDLRGRVMSIYALTFFGLMPVGALLAGILAEHVGEPAAVMAAAAGLGLFAVAVQVRVPGVRRLE